MSGRNENPGEYRYGFNGKELDQNGSGGGGSTQDYGFRICNPQIGKFLSVDPLAKDYPWYTQYQFAGNKPIWAIDLDGLEEFNRTRYFDLAGNLYRTEISVVRANTSYTSPEPTQIIHETTVNDVGGGNLVATYVGTTTGTAVAVGTPASGTDPVSGLPIGADGTAGGSTAFTAQESLSVWSNTNTGNTTARGGQIWARIAPGGTDNGTYGMVISMYEVFNGNTFVIPPRGNNGQVRARSTINDGIASIAGPSATPGVEAYLPKGFNVTPAQAANRFSITGGQGTPVRGYPTPPTSLNGASDLTIGTNLDARGGYSRGKTFATGGPPTTVTQPSRAAAASQIGGARQAPRTLNVTF